MASKRTKAAATDDELGDLFEGLGGESALPKTAKAKAGASKIKKDAAEADILAELENQLEAKEPSRPHTPRIRDPTVKAAASQRTSTNTPPPATERTSEDKPAAAGRKSVDSNRSLQASFTPSATSSELQEPEKKATVEQTQAASGGGWWGGILSTATMAMKQAEAAVKEIQQNEEAKKWADQVRGNVGALRGLGDNLRQQALPTFTNILHTLAPPISSHERLLIHITHDIVGYPSLDPLIHGVFSRVMSQVEGGDLLVIQRGQESNARSPSAEHSGAFFSGGQSTAGWHDGPWWRASDSRRDLGAVGGLVEGSKLCRASAEAYAADFFNLHGGLEAARKRALEPMSESNPVRSSDLFLAVQAIKVQENKTLFASGSATEAEKSEDAQEAAEPDELVHFAIYVLDPVHEISFATVSQSIPARWVQWLDTEGPLAGGSQDEVTGEVIPDEIREIVAGGGVDPREWVAEWMEDLLNLAVGVVAQRYVARRMGVGEGGLGKGKRRADVVVEEGGGEIARAGLI